MDDAPTPHAVSLEERLARVDSRLAVVDARLAVVDARLAGVDAHEAIRALKYAYCAACDAGYDPESLVSMFTEDAVFDPGPPFGRCEGRDAIRYVFSRASSFVRRSAHLVANAYIELAPDGRSAVGEWLLIHPHQRAGDGVGSSLSVCRYSDVYRLVEGKWMFAEVHVQEIMNAPLTPG